MADPTIDWIKFQLLTHLSKEKVLKSAQKLGISHSILASLCSSPLMIQEILSYTGNPNDLQQQRDLNGFSHAMRLENYLISQGHETEWKKVLERYGFDPMRSYFALQTILTLLSEQIQKENQIEQFLTQIEQMLVTFLKVLLELQGSGNTLQLINPQVVSNAMGLYNNLNQIVPSVIEMITYHKYSKRFEHQSQQQALALDWPSCPKFQQWLETLLRQSWNFANYARQLKTHFDTLNNIAGNFVDRQMLTQIHNLATNSVNLVSRLLNGSSVLKLDAPTGFVRYPSNIRLKLRHLLGLQLMQMIPRGSKAKLSLINSLQVKSLLHEDSNHSNRGDVGSVPSGDLENNDGDFIPHEEGGAGHFVVNFSRCRVVRPNRVARPANGIRSGSGHGDTVKDEKFCFLCEFVIQLFPNQKITVWALSDPVVVASNTFSQEIRSLATLFWDMALRTINRVDLEVPKTAKCSQIVDAMEEEQIAFTQIGFSEENKNYMLTRLQGLDHSGEITFERFCEEIIPGTNFTLWQWFIEGLRLGDTHFLSMWTGGYVEGFLGRIWTERVLSTRRPGTFLVRISESVLGAVTVSWIHSDCKVYSLGPFTKSVLSWKELADAIVDLSGRLNLQYIYPDQDLGIFLAAHTPQPGPERPIPAGYIRVIQQLQLLALPVSG